MAKHTPKHTGDLFTLALGENDEDIREWLNALPAGEKARAVKDAIRAYKAPSATLTAGRVWRELSELRALLVELQKEVKRRK